MLVTVWPDGYIIFQYLAKYNIERLPKNMAIFAKVGLKFGKHWINPQPFDKDSKNVAKVANIRQIWSHRNVRQVLTW